MEYSSTRNNFIQSIGKYNVGVLDDLKELHLHDFGIFLDLSPDDEEKQLLENNIQMALSRDQIFLEDAIDIRNVKNLKLANELLKLRRKKKMNQDREMQKENIALQSQSNAQAAQAAAQADVQKQQALSQTKLQVKNAEHELEVQKMGYEVQYKKELMTYEFELSKQLKELDLQVINNKEEYKEDRKDKRTKIQASQQSELIDQRKNNKPPKDFESSSFDTLGGFGLEQFSPR